MAIQTAQLKYLRLAPRKVRLVADLIKGLPIDQAEAQLMLNPRRAAKPLLKLLRSAVSNAKNNKLNLPVLIVSSIRVDQGSMLKRYLPRAKGSASPLQKKMSHVFLELKESSRAPGVAFKIIVEKKTTVDKNKKKETRKKPIADEMEREKPKAEKAGGWRRIFRRKSI